MITGKAKSGIFSGLEQIGVTDQSSAQRQLQNLRDQKNALGEQMEDTFTMREETRARNDSGSLAQSAVIPSLDVTARSATT